MKKNKTNGNYLDNIPVRNPDLGWEADEKGIVTLSRENKGIANKIAQKLLRKPKVSYIHLDEIGSCVWKHTDGEKTIFELASGAQLTIAELLKSDFDKIIENTLKEDTN